MKDLAKVKYDCCSDDSEISVYLESNVTDLTLFSFPRATDDPVIRSIRFTPAYCHNGLNILNKYPLKIPSG